MTEHPQPNAELMFNVKACESGLSLTQAVSVSSDHAYGHFYFQLNSSPNTEELQHHLLLVL